MLGRLSLKNLLHKPLNSVLSVLLFGLGVGMIILLLLVNKQTENNLDQGQLGIDLVVGAKGSPLQLVLSAIYHVDVPTGNIPLEESKPFLNPQHPLIAMAVPLALGDSYRGYRIVGTDSTFRNAYGLEPAEGGFWDGSFQVVVGSQVAGELGLKIGDTFQSNHGFESGSEMQHDHVHPFRVVGILQAGGTVADRLILCDIPSIWDVHDHSESSEEGREITAMLIRFKHKTSVQSLNFLRNINENTGLMAASPSYEMSKLVSMVGAGTRAIRLLAIVIIIVSVLSIFLTMVQVLRQRKYELALIRVMGASPGQVFLLILLEAAIISVFGVILGFLAGHFSMAILGQSLQESYGYPFSGWRFYPEEIYVLLLAFAAGLVAALIPAIQASSRDIHHTLADNP